MRSFNLKTSLTLVALTASALAVPFAGAYAAQSDSRHGVMDLSPPATFQGTRIDSILNEVAGINQGIADGRQDGKLTPVEANQLDRQAAAIVRTAERTAAVDHDRVPAAQYNSLMRRVDHLDESLLTETGMGPTMGDGN